MSTPVVVTFKYIHPHDALKIDGNGKVVESICNLRGTDQNDYTWDVTVCNRSPGPLQRDGVETYVDSEDLNEDDCCCWADEKLRLEDCQKGHRNSRAYYEWHITKMLQREQDKREVNEAKTDEELAADREPVPLERKSFMSRDPSER